MIKGDKMLTHNFKIINDPSQWDEDMKNFFNSLAEYWLSIHPKPNRRWREEYAMKLYKQLNGDFIEIFARWKIYFSNYCIECGRQLEGDLKYCPWCGMDRSMDSAVVKRISKLRAEPASCIKNQDSSKPTILDKVKARNETNFDIEEGESMESYGKRLHSLYWNKKKVYYKLLIEWHMYSSEKCISCGKSVEQEQKYCPHCGNQIFKVSDETVKWIDDKVKSLRINAILQDRPLSVHKGTHEWDREGLSYEEYMEMYYNM